MIERRSKEEIVGEIAALIAAVPPKMSTGSTEPREIFELVNETLGLRVQRHKTLTKPELARAIVLSAGFAWEPDFESRGGTVTWDGLNAVLGAVQMLVGD